MSTTTETGWAAFNVNARKVEELCRNIVELTGRESPLGKLCLGHELGVKWAREELQRCGLIPVSLGEPEQP